MKKIFFLSILLFVISSVLVAQPSLNIFAGYGMSAFDTDLFGEGSEIEQAGYLPVGAQILYGFGKIDVGAEFHYAVVPYTFELSGSLNGSNMKVAEYKINQMFIGAVLRTKFGKGKIKPYFRAGGGMYLGGSTVEYSDEIKSLYQQNGITLQDEDQDIKSAFGFNLGGGVNYFLNPKNAIILEFVYHLVKREPDVEDSKSFTANNWAVQVGYSLGLR